MSIQPLATCLHHRPSHFPRQRLRLLLHPHTDRIARPRLGRLARLAWLNLPLEYPEFSFERLTLVEHQVELVVLGPPQLGSHPAIRGVMAHYKAMVTRLAGLGRSVWRPGYSLELLASERRASPGFVAQGTITPAYLRALIGDREK